MQMFYGTNTAPALTGISCPATIGNIMHRTYNFHSGAGDNGNVWVIANCRDTNRTQNFAYDNLNRITQAYTSGTNWGETFTIDGWGNLTNKGPVTGKTNYENFNAAPASIRNQLNGYCHDSAGNLVLNGACPTGTFTPTYSYDIENRLVGTAGFTYVYDGDGKRLKKCSNAGCTTGILYWTGTGSDTLQESDFAGNVTEDYIFFNGKRVARRDASGGAVHYYVADHLGSTDVVTSSAGTIQKEADNYPYGGEIIVSGSDINTYKFTGKERDTESGLDMFGARYYGSSLSRFMTPDWAAKPTAVPYAMFGNPQSLNLYSYVRNNPTTVGDPDGHCPDGCPLPSQLPQTLADLDRQNQANQDFYEGALKGLANFVTSSMNAFATMGESTAGPIPQIQPTNENQAIGMTAATIGLGAASLLADAPAASTIKQNAAKGAAFQDAVAAETATRETGVVQNLQVKAQSGTRTVIDVAGKTESGAVHLQEAKSSATARLTPAQAKAHPEIAQTGATVVSKNKPSFPQGAQIPPTKVDVVRPQ